MPKVPAHVRNICNKFQFLFSLLFIFSVITKICTNLAFSDGLNIAYFISIPQDPCDFIGLQLCKSCHDQTPSVWHLVSVLVILRGYKFINCLWTILFRKSVFGDNDNASVLEGLTWLMLDIYVKHMPS